MKVTYVFLGVKETGSGSESGEAKQNHVPLDKHDFRICPGMGYKSREQVCKAPVEDPRRGDDGRLLYCRKAPNDQIFEQWAFCERGHGNSWTWCCGGHPLECACRLRRISHRPQDVFYLSQGRSSE